MARNGKGKKKDDVKKPKGASKQVLGRQAAFLDAFRRIGKIKTAAENIGVSRETVRLWRLTDELFESKFMGCRLAIADSLLDVSVDEAHKPKNVTERIFLLRAMNPETFADSRKLTISTPVPLKIVEE